MSLVINSNSWWSYEVSNWQSSTSSYPDFSQLLLKPRWWTSMMFDYAIDKFAENIATNLPTALNINWTIVNYLCDDLIFPNCEFWISSWWWYWSLWAFRVGSDWTEATMRIWLNIPLEAWKIIWKKIRREACASVKTGDYLTSSASITFSLTAVVKLLHTDWTLTTVWDISPRPTYTGITALWIPYFIEEQSNWTFWNQCYKKFVETNTAWVVALEWDIVVCDIAMKSNQSSYYALIFWNNWSWDDVIFYRSISPAFIQWWIRPRPIEVSIE